MARWMFVATIVAVGVAPILGGESGEKAEISDLAFLAGSWTGGDGTSEWESVYTGPEGGRIVGASKELRGGRTVMIDFEHFYEREGELRMTPYPFGNKSVEFTLTSFDRQARQAVFENPEHDFPKKFTYRAGGDDALTIELEGEMGGSDAKFAIEFKRR
jgi:hypothetical protein